MYYSAEANPKYMYYSGRMGLSTAYGQKKKKGNENWEAVNYTPMFITGHSPSYFSVPSALIILWSATTVMAIQVSYFIPGAVLTI